MIPIHTSGIRQNHQESITLDSGLQETYRMHCRVAKVNGGFPASGEGHTGRKPDGRERDIKGTGESEQ